MQARVAGDRRGERCAGILLQYAPITAGVVAALPDLGIVSRIGAGFDTVDVDAQGAWHMGREFTGLRHRRSRDPRLVAGACIAAKRRPLRPRHPRRPVVLPLRRSAAAAGGADARHRGLGRIGKRMAHVSRNVFRQVIAYDPFLIDGDFPAYVRARPRSRRWRERRISCRCIRRSTQRPGA